MFTQRPPQEQTVVSSVLIKLYLYLTLSLNPLIQNKGIIKRHNDQFVCKRSSLCSLFLLLNLSCCFTYFCQIFPFCCGSPSFFHFLILFLLLCSQYLFGVADQARASHQWHGTILHGPTSIHHETLEHVHRVRFVLLQLCLALKLSIYSE